MEIGEGKSARRAYGFEDISIVPSRRTRDPRDVDISWEIDAYRFTLPVLASAMDGVTSPATAIEMARLGGAGVLNLEGLWTRHEDADVLLDELAAIPRDRARQRLCELYSEPVRHELIAERIKEVKSAGAISVAALRPQLVNELADVIARAELDLFVIQGTVVSAEHKSKTMEPLNLKRFIREYEVPTIVGGCASYQAALHLMRTGAMGILVGVGSSEGSTTADVLGVGVPQATAIADARGARMRHLDETGVYCHVIADGGMHTAGDIAKAVVCGADAVMIGAPLAAAHEAPAKGAYWGMTSSHATLPRGQFVRTEILGSLSQILTGPSLDVEGKTNLFGALKTSMSTTGHVTLKDFQKADVVLTTSSRTKRDGNG